MNRAQESVCCFSFSTSSLPPVCSYEGVLASYLPITVDPFPFSCFGEEQPGVGPL